MQKPTCGDADTRGAALKLLVTAVGFWLASIAVASADNLWVKADSGNWKPDARVVTNLKAGIEQYVVDETRKHGVSIRTWNEYAFQYMGYEDKNGKSILVNALCNEQNPVKLKTWFVIADGGNCYFSVVYDTGRRRFHSLFVNGQ